MLGSCAHNEPGITSILRSNSDKRAMVRLSGNMKNASAANSLEFGWIDPPHSNDDLPVVKVEQYMVCLLGPLTAEQFEKLRQVSGPDRLSFLGTLGSVVRMLFR